MKIAIHNSRGSEAFSKKWIRYCEENSIPYCTVNCYNSDIVSQLKDCTALMWHFHHLSVKDLVFAKQLLYSLQAAGKKVFPDYNTAWHFDDKLGQKYLLESIDAPLVPTWVFYDKREALAWKENIVFPLVFKLRGGAGSQNVRLVSSKKEASRLIKRAFGKGFPAYSAVSSLKERWRLYRLGENSLKEVLKGLVRLVVPPEYSRMRGNDRAYVYFQKFVPDNDYDIRVVVIDHKAFAIKRMVRKDDFRASGSGTIKYDPDLIGEDTLRVSFDIAEKLGTQSVALDYVYENDLPFVVEISYGFSSGGYNLCPGYWDRELNWHEGAFNPYGWMVDQVM